MHSTWISLQDHSLSLISKNCTDCETSNKYDAFTAGKFGNGTVPCFGGVKPIVYMDGRDPNNTEIVQAQRSGYVRNDVFNFSYVGQDGSKNDEYI